MGGDPERIKERLDIVDVISGYIKLEKAGTSYKARCPFHTEKTPSFHVSPVRQSYYCFGCGAKGDIFTFVEEMEGIEFREALKTLADKAGIELQYSGGQGSEGREEVAAALKVIEVATEFFEQELSKSKAALEYLERRGLKPEAIKKWRIGYAPNEWRALRTHLLAQGFTEGGAIKAGLLKKGEQGRDSYDVFRNRIIFPLSDQSGQIIAFSGRTLPGPDESEAKYINSPDSIVFNKSEVLYGLDKAKEEIRRKNYTVLLEGQFDLLLSHECGVVNAVATSGTAFTEAHLGRLKRLSKRLILAFDGDTAGDKAAYRSSELALPLGLEVKVAPVPPDTDPASLIASNAENWKDVLRRSLTTVEYFLERLMAKEKDMRKLGGEVATVLLPLVAKQTSAIDRSQAVALIAKRTGIREEALWEDLRQIIAAPKPSFSNSSDVSFGKTAPDSLNKVLTLPQSRKEVIIERLVELEEWKKELPADSDELKDLALEEKELRAHLEQEKLREELADLRAELFRQVGDSSSMAMTLAKIQTVMEKIKSLEDSMK